MPTPTAGHASHTTAQPGGWPTHWPPGGVVFWFRHDLRLHDQPALTHAIELARQRRTWLLPVVVLDPAQTTALTPWGFARQGPHRQQFVAEGVAALAERLHALGTPLWVRHADPVAALTDCVQQLQASELVCEDIPAPEEQATVAALTTACARQGARVTAVWQSTLYTPECLPMRPEQVPDTFTAFRQKLEASGATEAQPLPAIAQWPSAPPRSHGHSPTHLAQPDLASHPTVAGHGSEAAALAHLARYCARGLPHTYKATRNALMGFDHSSRWSPWLATGALSARTAMAAIRQFEVERGANDGTHWLWFELLWRDHFRWMHAKHGAALYREQGLRSAQAAGAKGPSNVPSSAQFGIEPHTPRHSCLTAANTGHALDTSHAERLQRWCEGRTGQPLVDAGMRELAATGWLGNRLRQVVASCLIHDLQGDWRAGAAWFEHALIDYDPCSNQGNWAYIAGRGTDPRGGRRFNPDKQTQDHDPDGHYRREWGTA